MLDLDNTMAMLQEWLAELGEDLVRAQHGKSYHVECKSSAIDYLTEYDIKTETELKKRILLHFPDHGILSEESAAEHLNAEYLWVIDPIDGTTNFAHGFPFFAISVALKYRGETVLAVVYGPALGQSYQAIRGQGAYLADSQGTRKLEVSRTSELKRSLIASGFPYKREENNVNLPYFLKLINRISGIRRCGSASLDIAMTAAGMLDAYWEFCLSEWDYAAAALILTEAGGEFLQLEHEGENLVIAANPQLFPILKRVLLEESYAVEIDVKMSGLIIKNKEKRK